MNLSLIPAKRGLGLLAILILVMAGVYYYLGGFNPVRIEVVSVKPYILLGKEFNGSYRSDTLRNYFNQMKGLRDSLHTQGPVALIYDQEPQGSRGMVRSFTGLKLDSPSQSPLPNFKIRTVSSQRAVRVSKECHAALMPNPSKIETMMKEFIKDRELSSYNYNVELYFPDNRLVIERPLRD